MLLLLTWVTMTFGNPSLNRSLIEISDTVRSQSQDSIQKVDTGSQRNRTIVQQRKEFRSFVPFATPPTDGIQPTEALDSLFSRNPTLRAPLLKALLIPAKSADDDHSMTGLEFINLELEKERNLSPFDLMSLIAERCAEENPADKSLKSNQLNIIGTVFWLMSVLK